MKKTPESTTVHDYQSKIEQLESQVNSLTDQLVSLASQVKDYKWVEKYLPITVGMTTIVLAVSTMLGVRFMQLASETSTRLRELEDIENALALSINSMAEFQNIDLAFFDSRFLLAKEKSNNLVKALSNKDFGYPSVKNNNLRISLKNIFYQALVRKGVAISRSKSKDAKAKISEIADSLIHLNSEGNKGYQFKAFVLTPENGLAPKGSVLYSQIEDAYKKSCELQPTENIDFLNYAEFLFIHNNWRDAHTQVKRYMDSFSIEEDSLKSQLPTNTTAATSLIYYCSKILISGDTTLATKLLGQLDRYSEEQEDRYSLTFLKTWFKNIDQQDIPSLPEMLAMETIKKGLVSKGFMPNEQ